MAALVLTIPGWVLWAAAGTFLVFLLTDVWLFRILRRQMRVGTDLVRAVRGLHASPPARVVQNENGVHVTGWRALKLGTRTVVDVEDVLTAVELFAEHDASIEDLGRALRRQYGVMLAPGAWSPEDGWTKRETEEANGE